MSFDREMQRTNIHLPKDDLLKLDKLAEKARYGVARADLIRYAIQKTYGFPSSASWKDDQIKDLINGKK